MNPKNDYQGAFDYAWSLTKSGAAVFAGIFHEIPAGSPQMFSVEQGFILPFKNGQVEFQVGELNLNTKPMWGFQTRIIANFQKIFRK